jgi:hypothetical protein
VHLHVPFWQMLPVGHALLQLLQVCGSLSDASQPSPALPLQLS